MVMEAMPAALDEAALQGLRAWTGRSEETRDDITAAPLRGWSATHDRADAPPRPGDAVPPLGHCLYFLPQAPQGELGPDGHPRRGGFLPPVPLPRRMWAGGRLAWNADNPLRVGDAARRVSRIESVSHKSGRSGEMVFVLVKHEVHNARGLALTEEHDIVYRGAPLPGATPPAPQAAEQQAPWRREIVPEVEGYPGLVEHGPLIATLLVDLARRHAPDRFVRRFEFRAVRPTFDLHPFFVNGAPSEDGRAVRLWAHDHEGWLTVQGELEFE